VALPGSTPRTTRQPCCHHDPPGRKCHERQGKVVVVTGAVEIGLAHGTRFAREGVHVVLSDLDQETTARHVEAVGAYPVAADVSPEEDMANLIAATVGRFGRIDMFVSNAGTAIDGGIDTPTEEGEKITGVNLISEIYAAKYAIPHMLDQGAGYLLNVASAAGLLVIYDTVSYTVTKHAAIGFSGRLAATYKDQGIGVSVLARPQPRARSSPARRHPGRSGRHHHQRARRHRHPAIGRRAIHDLHPPLGAREVRRQRARLRRVRRDDAGRSGRKGCAGRKCRVNAERTRQTCRT
jgi:NAD(P)-dependent dehydrogenase (short-subunit alcohol dehydrogenase family)